MSSKNGRSAGFTLLEALIVVAIIGVVMAITMPAVSAARTTAAVTGSLANLKTQGEWLASYAQEHRGVLLNPFRNGAPSSSVQRPYENAPTPIPFLPDSFSGLYASLVGHDLTDDLGVYEQAFFAPLDPYLDELRTNGQTSSGGPGYYRRTLTPTSYYYSSAMYQRNERFTSDGTRRPAIRRRRMDEIVYPAFKVAVHERADFSSGRCISEQPRWFEAGARPAVLLCDGHATLVSVDEIYAAVEAGDAFLAPAFAIDVRIPGEEGGETERDPLNFKSNGLFWATRDGLAGRDVP
jgi:prepilin-type N-terminal cleavage/methylation domain-containing protein